MDNEFLIEVKNKVDDQLKIAAAYYSEYSMKKGFETCAQYYERDMQIMGFLSRLVSALQPELKLVIKSKEDI